MALRLLSVLAVCAAVSMPAALAAQCMPDTSNPCKARCNGTSFDLSKAFDFPINITEPTPRPDSRTYWYMWSPCASYDCPGYKPGTDCAFCQKANVFYCCGKTSKPIWVMEDYQSTKEPFPNWKVEYTFGTTWRIVVVRFIVEKNLKEPEITFISEDPYLQYNFEVRGACIGQESFECEKYYQT